MVIAFCALLGLGYWVGGRRPLRVIDAQRRWSTRHWRTSAIAAGLAIVLLATLAPIDGMTRQTVALRTGQLIVLAMVASPLLVLGAPLPRWRRLIGRSPRGDAGNTLSGAVAAFILFNGALILAYLPPVFAATSSGVWASQAEEVLVVLFGIVFWSQVITQPPARCALTHVGRIFYLFLSSAVLRILGLVLGFAAAPFYAVSLFDQQIAAGILLVPGVLTDLIVLTVCMYLWLAQDDRAARRSATGGPSQRAFG
jgi:cytochrome c oxidase assembly factor CtaG